MLILYVKIFFPLAGCHRSQMFAQKFLMFRLMLLWSSDLFHSPRGCTFRARHRILDLGTSSVILLYYMVLLL